MECLQIDWKNIDNTFVRDEFYENIQAPMWIDFNAPLQPVDDNEWFCGKVGCTHEKAEFLQEAPDQSMTSLQASDAVAHVVAPLAEETVSAVAAAGKRARGVVSSSLSSLSDMKAAFAKNKVLHLPQMPSIAERKGDAAKKSSQRQAGENENPNQACKSHDGASKKPIFRAPEGIAKKLKVSETKDGTGREPRAQVPSREVPARVFKTVSSTLPEKVNQPQIGSVLDVSKSTIILGKRDAMHGKSTLSRIAVKEQVPHVCSTSEAKIKKAEGTRVPLSVHPSRLAAKSSHLTASLSIPIKRSTAAARSLHGVYLGNQKSVPCKPPRVIAKKEIKIEAITAHMLPYQKRSVCKEVLEEGSTSPQGDLQILEENAMHAMQAGHGAVMLTEQELYPSASVKEDELEHKEHKDDDVSIYTASLQDSQTQTLFKDGGLRHGKEVSVYQPMMQEKWPTEENEPLTQSARIGEEQPPQPLEGVEEQGKTMHTQTREKEESICHGKEVSVHQPMMQEKWPTEENEPLTQSACIGEEQPPQPLEGVEEQGKTMHTQTREKEESIQSTLENFLKNLRLTTPEDEMVSHNHGDCTSEQEMVKSDNVDCTTEQALVQPHHVDGELEQEMVLSHHVDGELEQEMVLSHHLDGELEQEMVQSMRFSSQSAVSSQMSKPLNFQDGSYAMSAASQVTSSTAVCVHTTGDVASMDSNKNCEKKAKQKHNLQMMKDWQRSQGRKRKSSELNFKVNCSSKDHRHENHKVPATGALVSSLLCQQYKQFSTTKLPMMAHAPPSHGFLDSCKEQHKKIKTAIVQPFKPFRLRTEERGALRELGLGRKEPEIPNPQEFVHRALRMPSFGHPFRPQRSTKKLTIPKEPNFHPSRTKKVCTRHATVLAS